MWVKTAAIRPVPPYALVPEGAVHAAERWLGDPDDEQDTHHAEAVRRFEERQPELAAKLGDRITRTRDDVALTLGFFLTVAVWLAFDRTFGERLAPVTEMEFDAVDEALTLDESLRGQDAMEPVNSDDVVAMEQPHLLELIAAHIDTALELHAAEVDVDAVDRIYRLVLVELLALSYAVAPPPGMALDAGEVQA